MSRTSKTPRARGSPSAREVISALGTSDVFSSVRPVDLRRLATVVRPQTLPGGRLLFEQGDPADAVYIVVGGRLRASVRDLGDVRVLGEIGQGEVVGETALVMGGRRTASVRAIRDCELLVLRADAFRRVVRDHPDVLIRIAGVIARRAGRSALTRSPVRTITVASAGAGRGADLRSFATNLTDALRALGGARTIRRQTIERALGQGAADDARSAGGEARVIAWMHAAESRSRFVVFEADPSPTPWTLRCLRQADLVLLVGDGRADTGPGETESTALAPGEEVTDARRWLVLQWPDGRPSGTSGWLEARRVDAHHHIVDEPSFARLARFIAGRAIGLVLGGGGARGLAHLGVIRAIEEAGIPIDAVGGTSIGAILGGGCAAGWNDEVRVRKAIDSFVKTRLLVGPTLPVVSYSSSRKITRLLEKGFEGLQIEDLPLPFFCVSANMTAHETVIHERGPLWLATRTSASLPGILPPVYMDGDLLVDGGVVNDVPVGPMRERLEGTVIACDINPEAERRVRDPIEPTLSGWRVLGRKLNPFSRSLDVPNVLEVIMHAKEIGGRRAQMDDLQHSPADLVIRPPTAEVGALEFKAGERLIDIGYRAAAEQLAQWPETSRLADH